MPTQRLPLSEAVLEGGASLINGSIVFDDTLEGSAIWQFRMTLSLLSITALAQYTMADVGNGKVSFDIAIAAITVGDAVDVDQKAFASPTNINDNVPVAAGRLGSLSVTLVSLDNLAVNDLVRVKLSRKVLDAVNDTALGDFELRSFSIDSL